MAIAGWVSACPVTARRAPPTNGWDHRGRLHQDWIARIANKWRQGGLSTFDLHGDELQP